MFLPRLWSTIFLLVLFGVSVFAPEIYRQNTFYVMLVFMTFALTKEFCSLLKEIQMSTFEVILPYFTSLCAMVCGLQIFYPTNLIIVLILFFIFIFLFMGFWSATLFIRNSAEKLKKLLNSLTAGLFIMIPVVMVIMIYTLGEGMNQAADSFNILFLFFILVTKIGDIGAYVVGNLSNRLMKGGNHKMIPSISPGKSWEGAAGGLLFTILLCLFFCFYKGLVASVWAALILGTLFFLGGMAGDLAESSMKRAAKVKDSGATIPGIGGVFDLVDSLLMTAPLFLLIFVIQLFLVRFGLVFFNI